MPAAPLVYETHLHTPLCRHAVGEIGEYAAVAHQRRLRGIIVTCHNPMPGGYDPAVRMAESEFGEYLRLVEEARTQWTGRVDVRLGLECDFFPRHVEFVRRQIASAPFDYILGSVHPHTAEFVAEHWRGDALSLQRAYFDQLALAAESGLFDCLAHPDVIKSVTVDEWDLRRLLPDIRHALARIAAMGTAMELNTSGLDKPPGEMNPGRLILREMRKRGIPVVVGSDAHWPQRVADRFIQAYDLLEKAGYDRVSLFLGRKRQEIGIAEARASLI